MLKDNFEPIFEKEKKTYGFSIIPLRSFLDNDTNAMKKTLHIFLEDTKQNMLLLKQAKKSYDVYAIQSISHKMITMFKQLEVKALIPFLETFETSNTIDDSLFIDFENQANSFIISLEVYIN